MSYQRPPDDPYQQQGRPSFTPYQQGQPPYTPPQGQQAPYRQPQEPYHGRGEMQPAVQDQRGYSQGRQSYPPQVPPSGHRRHRQAGGKQYALRGAESFWYILGCISFGTAYFSKLPGKKAACEVFSELRLDGQGPSRGYSLRGAEGFWYVLMCIPFGGPVRPWAGPGTSSATRRRVPAMATVSQDPWRCERGRWRARRRGQHR